MIARSVQLLNMAVSYHSENLHRRSGAGGFECCFDVLVCPRPFGANLSNMEFRRFTLVREIERRAGFKQ